MGRLRNEVVGTAGGSADEEVVHVADIAFLAIVATAVANPHAREHPPSQRVLVRTLAQCPAWTTA